jgi:hypothetical protein
MSSQPASVCAYVTVVQLLWSLAGLAERAWVPLSGPAALNAWSLSNQNSSISINNVTVPGYAYSELQESGILQDLLYRWESQALFVCLVESPILIQHLECGPGHT